MYIHTLCKKGQALSTKYVHSVLGIYKSQQMEFSELGTSGVEIVPAPCGSMCTLLEPPNCHIIQQVV